MERGIPELLQTRKRPRAPPAELSLSAPLRPLGPGAFKALVRKLCQGRKAWGKTPKSAPFWRCRWHALKRQWFPTVFTKVLQSQAPKPFCDQGLLCPHRRASFVSPLLSSLPGHWGASQGPEPWLVLEGLCLAFVLEITDNKTQSTHNWNSIHLRSPPVPLKEGNPLVTPRQPLPVADNFLPSSSLPAVLMGSEMANSLTFCRP